MAAKYFPEETALHPSGPLANGTIYLVLIAPFPCPHGAICRGTAIAGLDRVKSAAVHAMASATALSPAATPASSSGLNEREIGASFALCLVDIGAQHRIDAGLVAASGLAEEIQHVAVDAHVEVGFRLGQFD